MTEPTKPSLDELRRYASEAEAAPQFCRWYAISVSHVKDAASFSNTSNTLPSATRTGHASQPQSRIERTTVLCTPRPKAGLQTRKCGTGKINSVADFFGALAISLDIQPKYLNASKMAQH